MDLRKLKTLIDLVAESDIAELEMTEGESKVRIVKSSATAPQQVVMMQQPTIASAPAGAGTASSGSASAPNVASAAIDLAEAEGGHIIKSPMVGTFYRAATPGGAPFIELGSTIKEGDTLCIIEAMKLLNEVDAEVSGVIKQVLVENGQPVEFGQPLFVVG